MKKKFIVTLSVLFLSITFPLIPANAATKAGGVCTKLGLTSIASGKTYTCIKLGKKLIWNKGEPLVKATPSRGKVVSPAFETARSFLDKLSNAPKNKNINKYLVSENLNLNQVQFMIDIQEKFVSFWQNEGIVFENPITTYFFTEKDINWVSMQNIPQSCKYATWFTDSFKFQADAKTCQTSDKKSIIVVPLGSAYLNTSNLVGWGSTMAAHEIEHVVQDQVFKYLMPDPCWFREGLTTYSVWIEMWFKKSSEDLVKVKKSTLNSLISNLKKSNLVINGKKYENWTNDEWLEVLNLEPANPICWGRNMDGTVVSSPIYFGYAAGPFVIEKMYIDFGLKASIKFMYQVGSKNNFSSAFSESFGVSYTDWMLNKAIPWLLSGG